MMKFALRMQASWSLAAAVSLTLSSPCLAAGHGHHTVYVVPSTASVQCAPTSVSLVPISTGVQLQSAQLTGVSLSPVSSIRMSTQAVQFTPQVQSVQLSPQVQTVQLTPQVQSVQAVPVTQSVQFATIPQTVQFVPQIQSIQMPAQNVGVQSVSAGSGDPTDYEYQVLTAGLGGSLIKFKNFEDVLRNKARDLLANRSGLSQSELTTLLVDFAKTTLNATGFGFLIDPAIETIIKKLADKIFRENQSGGQGQQGTVTPPNPVIPATGSRFDFTVTGRLTLSPVSGGGPPSGPTNGGLPPDLTPGGGSVAPSP